MKQGTVWIIDDDMVSQFALKYKIGQSYPNYRIVCFYTVEEAVIALKECIEQQSSLPDKLLLDLVLPGLNGWHFLEELEKVKNQMAHLEIYIVSAFSNSNDRKLVKEHPLVMGYFAKPLNKGGVDQMFLSCKNDDSF